MKFTFYITQVFSFSITRQCVGDVNVSQLCEGLNEVTLNFRSDKPAEELLQPLNVGFIEISPTGWQEGRSLITTAYGSIRCRAKLMGARRFFLRLRFTKVQCGNDIAEDSTNILRTSDNLL